MSANNAKNKRSAVAIPRAIVAQLGKIHTVTNHTNLDEALTALETAGRRWPQRSLKALRKGYIDGVPLSPAELSEANDLCAKLMTAEWLEGTASAVLEVLNDAANAKGQPRSETYARDLQRVLATFKNMRWRLRLLERILYARLWWFSTRRPLSAA